MIFKCILKCLIVCFTICSITLYGENDASQTSQKVNDFFVLTIPKSGSFLIKKMLEMLSGRNYANPAGVFPQMNAFKFFEEDGSVYISEPELEDYFLNMKQRNFFVLAHFNFADYARRFSDKNPEYIKIIQIRDLRDVCVSWAYFRVNDIRKEIGSTTFDQRLMYIITLGDQTTRTPLLNIYRNAVKTLEWIHKDDVIVSRFEDLVGPQGGGSLEAQENLITHIANRLNIPMNGAKLNHIISNLFGTGTPTFREGKIGSWKEHFTEAHKAAFEKHMGALQLELGYDLDWTED